MPKWIIRTLKWLIVLLVVLFVLAWLVLAAPIFSDARKSIVGNILTTQIGQLFLIEGDVRVVVNKTTRVHVSKARIPSTTVADLDLAKLVLLEWELDLPALLQGKIRLDNLVIDGLQTNMITTEDGKTSWTKRTPKPKAETDISKETASEQITAASPSIMSFLADKTVSFTNIGLLVDNKISGFEFVFDLKSVLLEQHNDGDLVSVNGGGTVNGEAFELEGKFPKNEPFTNSVTFGDIALSYNGAILPDAEGGGHQAKLVLDTGEIGEVFDVLGLARSFEGHGNLQAGIISQPNLLAIDGLDAVFNLSEGQKITLEGQVENLLQRKGVDLRVKARLFPEGRPPQNADSLKDLKLTHINAHILTVGQGAMEFEELVLRTNAFDQGLDEVGPISIGRIYRTPEKTLGLKDVNIQVGPKDTPYLVAKGRIGDVFNFSDVDMSGQLAGASSLLLKSLSKEDAARFGKVTAEFEVTDAPGHLSLKKLSARALDTELWTFGAEVAVGDMTKLSGLKAKLDFGVADSADFLAALGLDPVDVGALDFGISLEGRAKFADLGVTFRAGGSDLRTNLSIDLDKEINVIRGAIESNRIRLADLRDGTKALMSLRKEGAKKSSSSSPKEKDDDDGKPPIQPLVLDKGDVGKPDEEKGIFDLERMLTETDLEILLELKEFVGDAGVSSMSSKFVANEGQIEAGPLELYYGGGYFKITAQMDAIENPDLLKISGATSGWDFGNILDALGIKIDAHGTLSAWFDVAGNIDPPKNFARSVSGSASLSMGNGYVATSLLELAGLGIFPWLFSDELATGQTEIVCVKAPVRLTPGRVRFDSVVAETKSVQIVAKGEVDWGRDNIAIRAEPRRMGKPLSRSAWPFDVTGKLSDPKFKLQIGGSRSRRTDGADQMPSDRTPCTPDIMQLQ